MNGNGGPRLRLVTALISLVVGVVTLVTVVAPLYTASPLVESNVQKNEEQTQDAQAAANDAQSTADSALRLAVQGQLRRERVCSLSNTGSACRALFNRLQRSINSEQRHDLACAVAKQLDGPAADQLFADSGCANDTR